MVGIAAATFGLGVLVGLAVGLVVAFAVAFSLVAIGVVLTAGTLVEVSAAGALFMAAAVCVPLRISENVAGDDSGKGISVLDTAVIFGACEAGKTQAERRLASVPILISKTNIFLSIRISPSCGRRTN